MIMNKSLRLMTRLFVLSLVIPIFSLNPALVQAQNEPLGSAAFTISNVTPVPNETVLFSAAYSISGGGGNRYEWDFGDGVNARGVQVVHAFTTANDFKVTLTVTGNHHRANTISKWVYVGRPQGWTEETHQSAAGNYEAFFPQDKVLRMDIMISPENFRIMEDDLANRGMFSDGSDPVYVRATVKFNHHTWWHVGIRYKGQISGFSQ
jgi:spore coat protein H